MEKEKTLLEHGSVNVRLTQVCRLLIIIGIALTPFMSFQSGWIPTPIKMWLGYETHLSVYPLFIFSIIFLISNIRNKRIRVYFPLLAFYAIYFVINIIIVIHGDIVFPYYDLADFSKLEGGDAIAYRLVSSLLPFSNRANFIISNILKSCLTITTKFVFSYFVFFSIYLFYRGSEYSLLNDCWIGISSILPVLAVYAIFEYAYLMDIEWGAKALAVINPLLYEVRPNGYWWPPLYWNQVRSVFAEPSYLSYWAAAVLPLFMINIQSKKKVTLNIVELFFITTLVLSAFARSGTALTFGCYAVFIIMNLLANKTKALRTTAIMVVLLSISLILVSAFTRESKVAEIAETVVTNVESRPSVQTYVEGTVSTLTSSTARSNTSRFGMIKAQFAIFKEHPILGVNDQLIGTHCVMEYSQWDPNLLSKEMKNWITQQLNSCLLTPNVPKLNEYVYSLAYGGIVGFMINTLPFLVLVALVTLKFVLHRQMRTISALCGISMSAVVVAFGLSSPQTINYIYFIVFAFMLIETKSLSLKGEAQNA